LAQSGHKQPTITQAAVSLNFVQLSTTRLEMPERS